MKTPPSLAIVVPCFNEEEILPHTIEKLLAYLLNLQNKKLVSKNSFLLFVDDGSKDTTWGLISSYSQNNTVVNGLKLSRNVGHQCALLAGLKAAHTDVVVTIDADLQDEISVIEKMLDEYNQGAEIVYGVRNDRKNDSIFKKSTAELFYKFMNVLGVKIVFNHADFRLMSKKAIKALDRYSEVNIFLRAIIPLLGYKTAVVEYMRLPRKAGESKYPLVKMLSFALTGITSFSLKPLRIITALGFFIAFLSAVTGIWAAIAALTGHAEAPGWASLLIVVSFLGGVQLFALGIVGEYVGRIYMETKRRPLYEIELQAGYYQNKEVAGKLEK